MTFKKQANPTVIALIFTPLGLLACGLGVHLALTTRNFVATATRTSGTVVDLEMSRSDDSTTYHPVVEFTAADGKLTRFRSKTGSNPPSHREGDAVQVLYDPASPSHAEIDSFFSLWMGPLISGFIGLVFVLVGCGLGAAAIRRSRRNRWLRENGRRVWAEFKAVDSPALNPPTPVAGWPGTRTSHLRSRVPYYRIVATWTDDAGVSRPYISDYLSKDPSPYLQPGQKIEIILDPNDPGSYLMDLGFLNR